jgi:aspartyl-tRNA(Asn)/glutamyl-tRNA(Gln) amidotransferase subunit A
VMEAIAEHEPASPSIANPRIGVLQNFFNERLAPAVENAFDQALQKAAALGARLVPITVPDPAGINTIGRVILLSEAAAVLQPYLPRRDDFGADVLSLLDQGRLVSATDYIDAQRLRKLYQKQWAKLWDLVEVIFTPATPIQAPLIGQTVVAGEDMRLASTRFVRPFNVLGLPALSIPFGTGNLPAGIQIIGPPLGEKTVLYAIELLSQQGFSA